MPFMSQNGYVGLAKQTASGVYTTPARFMYVNSAEINPDTSLLMPDPEIGGGRDIIDGSVSVGTIKWSGSIDFNVRPDALGLLLLGVSGAVVSSGIAGVAYGHKFTPIDYLQPLSIERNVGGSLETLGYTDVKVDNLHIEGAAGEMVTGNVDVIAITETAGVTKTATSFEEDPIFTYAGGQIKLEDTVISVKSFSLDIKNNITSDDFRIGSRSLGSLQEGRRELTASLEIVPVDNTTFRKSIYGSAAATTASGTQNTYGGSLFIRLESPNGMTGSNIKNQLDITIPKAMFQASPLPSSGADMIVQTLELLPVKTTGEDVYTIVLRNSVSSY